MMMMMMMKKKKRLVERKRKRAREKETKTTEEKKSLSKYSKLTNRHALGVDGAQVGVLEKVHDKVLRRLFLLRGKRERAA